MGRLIEFIFFAIVAYFIFKFLNGLFSNSAKNYKKSPQNYQSNQNTQSSNSQESHIKWEAETVDYEEIETKDNEKK